MGSCTSGLANTLCFECKDKEWVEQKKEYFCKRYDRPLTRLDGNSGGAVRTMQCINSRALRFRKRSSSPS